MSFVIIGFETRYPVGRDPEDWVTVAPRGEGFDRVRNNLRVKDIRPDGKLPRSPDSAEAMQARWAVIGPAYEAWKAGEDMPEEGTPLGAWSAVTPEQAKFLKKMGIATVEAAAEMTEGTVQKLPFPSARRLPEMARAFLASQKDADLARENADMKERMAALEELLEEATAAQPKPRGRPRKAEPVE